MRRRHVVSVAAALLLVIIESSKAEPDALQLKSYARGVGNVRVDWKGADTKHDTLELIQVVQLSPGPLAEVSAEVLKLEKHAYEISSDAYGHTSPAQQTPPAD